jgi:two-component system NarL family sensor kinase
MGDRFETDTEKLKRRNRELSILNAVAEALNREVDLSRALHTALSQTTELLDLHTGWIWLMREETGRFYLAASQDLPPALANNPRRMEGWCYCLEEYEEGGLADGENVSIVTCSRLQELVDNGMPEATLGLRYHASVPLYGREGKPLGVMNVASTDWRELSDADLELLHTIADLLSIAVERTRLFAQSTQVGALEERNRLAREIHDTLAQGLAGIALHLETADAFLEAGLDAARTRQAVRQALELTRASIEEARRSVLDLRAAPLEGRTLAEALASLVQEQGAQGNLHTTFEATGENRPLPVRVEAGLYRIAQEALTNVVRHANAAELVVHLLIQPEQVRLTIEDDGTGFDAKALPQGRYGLVGLIERARLLGGTIEVSSSPGEGTGLEVTIPLEGKG